MESQSGLLGYAADTSARYALKILSAPTAIGYALLAWLALGAIAFGLARWRNWDRARSLYAIACAGAVAAVLWVTLLTRIPDNWQSPVRYRPCNFGTIPIDVEALLNWLLFLPFALLFVLATRRPLIACAATLGLSCAVELAQSFFLLGGCQLSDLVSNVVGGMAGAAAGTAIIAFRKRP